jgi:hypothetical protein
MRYVLFVAALALAGLWVYRFVDKGGTQRAAQVDTQTKTGTTRLIESTRGEVEKAAAEREAQMKKKLDEAREEKKGEP